MAMPRIPQDELDRLKAEVDLTALIRSKGVDLSPQGQNLLGRCPFHDDKTPSLVVTPSKGLWHCMGACQMGGSVIDWVMKADGVSFRHAVELLRDGRAATLLASDKVVRVATIPKLPSPVAADVEDKILLRQVVDYYHATLKQSPEALEYLKKRGLHSAEMIDAFKLGYANRTLGLRLPDKNREAGAQIRSRLEALGVFREASGHEHLRGSLVIPILSETGEVLNLYGRKTVNLSAGVPKHLYLPGPHRGVFNPAALRQKEIILCEALVDALSFWVHGFRNVTASYGVEGFTEEHLAAFLAHGVRRVYIAYDRDDAGDRAAEKLADKLISEGIEALRVQFPHGMDANEYIRKVSPPAKALGVLLQSTVWLGKGQKTQGELVIVALPSGERVDAETGEILGSAQPVPAPGADPVPPDVLPADPTKEAAAREEVRRHYPHLQEESLRLVTRLWLLRRQRLGEDTPIPGAMDEAMATAAGNPAAAGEGEPAKSPAQRPPDSSLLAAREPPPAPAAAAATEASAIAPKPADHAALPVPCKVEGEDVHLTLGDRRYRVRGLFKNSTFEVMRVNLKVTLGEGFHLDQLDLYNAKHRESFTTHAAAEVNIKPEVLKRDLGRILLKLESLQEERLTDALKPKEDAEASMDPVQKKAALDLLQDPNLLSRILSDFAACGMVGEETGKLVGYLAATSRKLDDPLGIIIQSSSAAGKSSLMEAVLAFMPKEERVKYSAMTGQALFYIGETDLKHKILALVEGEGAERASYALKLLQSEKELCIASTGKDPQTGKLITQEYRVEGPVMIILTTTAIDIDPELQNRCLVLSVDESREQTRAIHRLQREAMTLDGLVHKERRAQVLEVHRNAQRLLRPLKVVNPYAKALTFVDDRTRTRRDQMKYLGLINTIAFLHQYQRPLKKVGGLTYVEVTPADIDAANRLAHQVLGRSLDELAPQTRRLLNLVTDMVKAACREKALDMSDYRFTRRQVREATGWGQTQLKIHLARLEEYEYLLPHRGGRGQSFVYELLYRGEGQEGEPFLMGLIDAGKLKVHAYDAKWSGVNDQLSGGGRPQVGPISGGGRDGEKAASPTAAEAGSEKAETEVEKHLPAEKKEASYPTLIAVDGKA